MAIDFQTANDVKESYKDVYEVRHQAFKDLRRFWQGDFWKIAQQAKTARSIVSVFRDQVHSGSETLPDMKLVKNVVQKICVKYQTFLSPLPMIRVYVDPPGSDLKRRQATTKERYLYGVWNDGRMSTVFNRMGWYLPLMGDAFMGIWPDFDRNVPKPFLRSPEYAYPITNFDGSSSDVFLFAWKERQSVIQRQFPNWSPPQKGRLPLVGSRPQRGKSPDQEFEILEWSDEKEFGRWIGGQKVNGVEHGFGYNLIEHAKFIDVPDEPWGHGAVEQIVNQNEALNAMESLLFQAVLENVFPTLVLIDPAKAPEEIYRGPGSIIPINQGGNVAWLHPPTNAITAQMNFMAQQEHGMKEDSGLNEVTFGVSPASSIVTGNAIEDLQSAGTASTIEMVQSTGLGGSVVRWNEKAIHMGQTMFRDDSVSLFTVQTGSLAEINPRMAAVTIKGKELQGSTRNEVVFMPNYDMHTKVVIGLQMAGGGLVSKKWQREQVGIPDSDAMVEEMLDETVQDAVVGAFIGSLQQEPTPENAVAIEDQAYGFLQGATSAPTPHPLLAAGASPGTPAGNPALGGPPGGGGPPLGPALAPPAGPNIAGSPSQGSIAPQQPQQPRSNTITLNDAISQFQSLQGLKGQVFLLGEIVANQQTDGVIEVGITVGTDRDIITSQLPQLAGRLVFHPVQGQPNEPGIEVTPGKPPKAINPGQAQEAA